MVKKPTQKEIENWNRIRAKGVKKYQQKKKAVKKKSPVLKSIPKKRIYKINKVSKKEAERKRQYNALIKELKKLPENKTCQWPGCILPATDCHHGKGRVGKYLLMKKWLKFLCREHHIYAELNPEEAKEKGISFSRLVIN